MYISYIKNAAKRSHVLCLAAVGRKISLQIRSRQTTVTGIMVLQELIDGKFTVPALPGGLRELVVALVGAEVEFQNKIE